MPGGGAQPGEAAEHLLPLDGAALDAMVRREQVSQLYRQLPASIAGTIVGTGILAAAMWPVVPALQIIGWACLIIANQSWRGALYVRFRETRLDDSQVERWGDYWATGSGISGMLWGASAFLFFPTASPLHQAVLTILVFGITTGAVPLIASHNKSFYLFVLPALMPFVARNALEQDLLHELLALIEFVVLLAVVSFGRNHNRLLIESLRNRFENEALAERLRQQNVDLAKARETVAAASRSKTQFFAAASHDLRQPLHALGLFASALAEKVRDPEAVQMVASVNASAHALEELFNELLDISKIDAGAIKPAIGDFPAGRVLDRLRLDFEPEAAEKGLTISVRPCTAWLRSDPVLIERIMRNLVGNALRYTEKGGVLVACRRRGESIVFEVFDTGIGISAENRQRVFDEFYQVGNPERSSKRGLGLGLSIVRRLCDLLGHPVLLRSVPGRGTRFSLVVPCGEAPAAVAAPARQESGDEYDISGRLVVVVDDEASITDGMKVLLGSWGADVITSSDGAGVIERVHELGRMPDLIIADYRLGGGALGTGVIDSLRQQLDPQIPAFLVTGSSNPERVAEAAQLGYHMLLKPVVPEKLRKMIAFKLRGA